MDTNTGIFVNSKQDNQLLLNAIRNKFDARTPKEVAAFSPPKFNIPILKIPGSNKNLDNVNIDHKNSNMLTIQPQNASTQLNQFLLKQLQEKHTNNDLSALVLPKLQSSCDKKTTVKFDLPALQNTRGTTSTSMGSLTRAIEKLEVQENSRLDIVKSQPSTPANIDLTTALAVKFETHHGTPPTRDLTKRQQDHADQDFEIPFIDCDRLDISNKRTFLIPASNEYCVTDVSQLLLQHSLAEPSVIGRFLSIDDQKYMDPLPLKYFTAQFQQRKVKHIIEPFNFDTKSPDDLVLLALSKSQRRHYN